MRLAMLQFGVTLSKERTMDSVNRRATLTFTLAAAAAAPALLIPSIASAQRYSANEGKEIAPGVRRVELSKKNSEISAYSTVSMVDFVFQPGSKFANPAMASDMVCHCLEGELAIDQGMGVPFVAKAGDVWSCKKGMPETTENRGSTVGIMRVIYLLA